ncbi:hypothetical protein ES703_59725 [subsurface metagenome]
MTDKLAELRELAQGMTPVELRLLLAFTEFLARENARAAAVIWPRLMWPGAGQG